MYRKKRLNLRLSEKEYQALEVLSARENRNLSELVRELLRSAIEQRGIQTLGLVSILYPQEMKDEG